MVGEAFTALAAIKSASEATKAIFDLRDASIVQAKAIELQKLILDAQEATLRAREREDALVARVRDLEEEVRELRAWNTKADEYRLVEIDNGAFAYLRKPEARGSEPVVWFCAQCFEKHHRSILQNRGRTKDRGSTIYGCSNCHSEVVVSWNVSPRDEGT